MKPIKVQAHVPGIPEPVSLDDYIDLMTMIAACGMAAQADLLPDYLYYDNPRTGNKCSVERAPSTPGE